MKDRTEDPIKSRCIGINDDLWDKMTEAVQQGDYKSTSALVRTALTKLLSEEEV